MILVEFEFLLVETCGSRSGRNRCVSMYDFYGLAVVCEDISYNSSCVAIDFPMTRLFTHHF